MRVLLLAEFVERRLVLHVLLGSDGQRIDGAILFHAEKVKSPREAIRGDGGAHIVVCRNAGRAGRGRSG